MFLNIILSPPIKSRFIRGEKGGLKRWMLDEEAIRYELYDLLFLRTERVYIHDDYDLLHYCVLDMEKQNKASVQA